MKQVSEKCNANGMSNNMPREGRKKLREKRKELKKMLKPVIPDAESRSVANYMLERKRQMYPDNKRLMMNYELVDLLGGGFYQTVASTLDERAHRDEVRRSKE